MDVEIELENVLVNSGLSEGQRAKFKKAIVDHVGASGPVSREVAFAALTKGFEAADLNGRDRRETYENLRNWIDQRSAGIEAGASIEPASPWVIVPVLVATGLVAWYAYQNWDHVDDMMRRIRVREP